MMLTTRERVLLRLGGSGAWVVVWCLCEGPRRESFGSRDAFMSEVLVDFMERCFWGVELVVSPRNNGFLRTLFFRTCERSCLSSAAAEMDSVAAHSVPPTPTGTHTPANEDNVFSAGLREDGSTAAVGADRDLDILDAALDLAALLRASRILCVSTRGTTGTARGCAARVAGSAVIA